MRSATTPSAFSCSRTRTRTGSTAQKMTVTGNGDALTLTCDGFVWAGGQQKAPGKLSASLRRNGSAIEWDAVVEMERPVKSVSTIIRGVPRGHVSLGGGRFDDPKDNELLAGYAFGAGDLNGPGGSMTTPLLMIQTAKDVFYVSSLDDRMRPKRYYLAPGDTSYRVEAVYEHDAWRDDNKVSVPAWRLGRAATVDSASAPHMQHIEKAFGLKSWESRTDVPAWMRNLAMVTTLHGMHYTGYVFNDYAKMLQILQWIATQIPGDRVMVFVPAWDGRYYWDYPTYRVSERMGGEAAFRRLVDEGHKLGFKIMPMYGTNAANTKLPDWPSIASGLTKKIDGNPYYIDWVDWNNDRHGDGWLAYMNLGADAWREHLEGRISDMITSYGVDAYFLDIVGGHVNSTNGDMHEGTRRLVENLRAKHPQVACVGEMPYDALHGFIPMFQVGLGPRWSKYSRNFQHLSSPAPGQRKQRRARVGVLEIQSGDVVAVAREHTDAAGGGRYIRQPSRRYERDHKAREAEGGDCVIRRCGSACNNADRRAVVSLLRCLCGNHPIPRNRQCSMSNPPTMPYTPGETSSSTLRLSSSAS